MKVFFGQLSTSRVFSLNTISCTDLYAIAYIFPPLPTKYFTIIESGKFASILFFSRSFPALITVEISSLPVIMKEDDYDDERAYAKEG